MSRQHNFRYFWTSARPEPEDAWRGTAGVLKSGSLRLAAELAKEFGVAIQVFGGLGYPEWLAHPTLGLLYYEGAYKTALHHGGSVPGKSSALANAPYLAKDCL